MQLPLRNHWHGLEVKLELRGQYQSVAKYSQEVEQPHEVAHSPHVVGNLPFHFRGFFIALF